MSWLGLSGVVATVAYIGVIAWLQWGKLTNILDLDLNSFGDFLAGVLGPLGLFWLILSFFQQGRELRNSIASRPTSFKNPSSIRGNWRARRASN